MPGLLEDRRVSAFLAAAQTGSYSEAARALYVTQPAVSQQVRSLEDELGVKLFERSGNRMMLTTAGRVARDYLAKRDQLDREMEQALAPWSARRHLTIACPHGMMEYDADMYAAFVQLAAKMFPGADVTTIELPLPPDNYNFLVERRMDMAITDMTTIEEEHPGAIDAQPLRPITTYVVCRADGPLAAKGQLTFGDLAGQVVYQFKDVAFTDAILDALRTAPEPRAVVRRSQSLSSVLPLIEMGRGVTLYSQLIELPAGVTMVPLDTGKTRWVGLAWLKSNTTRAIIRFANAVAKLYGIDAVAHGL